METNIATLTKAHVHKCWIEFIMRTYGLTAFVVFLEFVLLLLASLYPAKLFGEQIRAGDNYCQEINDPASGNDLVLEPGEYKVPCKIVRGGQRGKPLIIRALDSSNRPRIHYDGRHGNVFEIYADNIIIRGLEFGPTRGEVDGIRIFSGDDIVVEDCRFSDTGGIAIVANHSSIRRLTVRRNKIGNSRSTAMYFGCQDGWSCSMADLLIEKNFITAVSAADPQIGYGIQFKLNSYGIVRDNIIVDTKGPGIMIYGAVENGSVTTVERNFISSSRNSAGIVLGGGPVRVWNNIMVSNRDAGISIEDYAGRGLLRGILIVHNTAYNNQNAGIVLRAEGNTEATIAYNAVASPKEAYAIAGKQVGIRVFSNADCSRVPCFVDPEQNNFSPSNGVLKLRRNGSTQTTYAPSDDYFGRRRPAVPVIGAIEPPGGSVRLEP